MQFLVSFFGFSMKSVFFRNIVSVFLVCGLFSQAFAEGNVEKKVPTSKQQVMLSFAPLVKKASPAIVNIYTKKKVSVKSGLVTFLNDPVLQRFFADNADDTNAEKISNSLGSGVIVSEDGIVVTNKHVIGGNTDITVVLSDSREFKAKIINKDERTDLALLKIEATDKDNFPFIDIADSDKVEVGDIVIALGNPFGVGQNVTNGIVSALAKNTVGASSYDFFIKTDAATNPGNSGGALINMQGNLVGINTSVLSQSGGVQSISFAVPSNMVSSLVRSDEDRVVRPWLGAEFKSVDQKTSQLAGLDRPVGAVLSGLYPGGPAEKAGLKIGDIVLEVDGREVFDQGAVYFRVTSHQLGDEAFFKLVRDKSKMVVPVRMVSPPENPSRDLKAIKGKNPLSGATIANMSPALAGELGISEMLSGVIIMDMGLGDSAGSGFRSKDVIKKVNGVDVSSTQEIETMLKDKNTSQWKIIVQRGSRLLNIIWNG